RLAGRANGAAPTRLALSTGDVERRTAGLAGPARERADTLAAHPGEAVVLLTASTAVMVSHALPVDVELVDLGVVALGPQRDERAYELRLVASDPGGGSD